MIASILAALGLARSTAHMAPTGPRRVRWRGSDGRWHWQAACTDGPMAAS
jgi:hypothetical protein